MLYTAHEKQVNFWYKIYLNTVDVRKGLSQVTLLLSVMSPAGDIALLFLKYFELNTH